MIPVRLRHKRMRDVDFRDYEVWRDGYEPQTVKALDATSAAADVHRTHDERVGSFDPGPTDWTVRKTRGDKLMVVRVTGQVAADYSGQVLGGVEKPETSRDV